MATGGIYQLSYQHALDLFYGTGTWRAMLVDAAYTESLTTHDYIDDVSANESSGTGYTAGGKVLVPVVSYDSGTQTVTVTFPQVQWTSATLSASFCVYYQDTGTPSTSRVGAINRFTNQPTAVTNGTFTAEALTIDFPFS